MANQKQDKIALFIVLKVGASKEESGTPLSLSYFEFKRSHNRSQHSKEMLYTREFDTYTTLKNKDGNMC